MPGSIAPGRVPMHSPSRAVKPMRGVDALAVLHRAHAGAAAEVRDDDPPVGDLGRDLGQHRGDVLVGDAVEAVPLHAAVQSSRGSGTTVATGAWPRWKPVSKQATCGTSGIRSKIASMGARLCGWCSGASGVSPFSSARISPRDHGRAAEARAAVDDPVAHADDAAAAGTSTAARPRACRWRRGRRGPTGPASRRPASSPYRP